MDRKPNATWIERVTRYNNLMNEKPATRLYLLNFALLMAHEIDSAYWKEWDLFGIPGGIQVFVILNFILILAGLDGLRRLMRSHPSGQTFAYILAGAGIFAFAIHVAFIIAGHPEFQNPVSALLLGAILVVSVMQVTTGLRDRRRAAEKELSTQIHKGEKKK
jgi:hypothetical protein